jgi:hypothetical protein
LSDSSFAKQHAAAQQQVYYMAVKQGDNSLAKDRKKCSNAQILNYACPIKKDKLQI